MSPIRLLRIIASGTMFNFFAGRGERTFESRYRVYPVSFIDKPEAENGDKIFMPPSALDRLGELLLLCCASAMALPQLCTFLAEA